MEGNQIKLSTWISLFEHNGGYIICKMDDNEKTSSYPNVLSLVYFKVNKYYLLLMQISIIALS